MKQIMANLFELQTIEMGVKVNSPKVKAAVEKLRATIPPQILGHYDRMMARGKKGVALVRNGVCRACHMGLAIGAMQVLRHGDDIQICGNCGRYLHLEAEVAPTAPANPAPTPKRRPRKTKKSVESVVENAS